MDREFRSEGLGPYATNHRPPASPEPPSGHNLVIHMFGTFLIGTVLVVSIVMLVLLVAPSPKDNEPGKAALPYIGVALLSVLILAAAIGGFAASA